MVGRPSLAASSWRARRPAPPGYFHIKRRSSYFQGVEILYFVQDDRETIPARASIDICHRLGGEGLPGTFPALNGDPFVVGDPKAVMATVLNGRKGKLGQMPTWKDKLTDQQIAAAVTYIRQAWSNRAPGVTPEMVAALRGK
jgi:hypothetical protein